MGERQQICRPLDACNTQRTYFDEAHGGSAIEDDLPKDGGTQQARLPQPLRAYNKWAHA